MLISNIYDAVIVGSGPAGTAAAVALAKAGKKVLIIEKEALPRYKTCGGGLTFRSVKLIDSDISGIIERNCYTAEINDFEANISILTKREKPIVSMTMRSDLDYHLIKEAKKIGIEVKEKSELKVIAYLEDSIEITINNTNEKLYTKFLIAADGALSKLAKKYFEEGKTKLIPALEYEIYVDNETLSYFCNTARFDFGIVPGGYGWVFPKKDHLSIGILSMKLKNGNLNNYFFKYLELLGIKKIIKTERHGFVIPLHFRNKYAQNRILLTGDAAGFVDPITAEGISFALLSGQIAAESIIKGNFLPDNVCSRYNREISERILPELRAGRILSLFIYSYSRLRIWIIKLYGKKLGELITDVVMGDKKYSELIKNPSNYLKLLYKLSLKNLPFKPADKVKPIQVNS